MAKAVIMETNIGTRILGSTQCSNGTYWTAQSCYEYCNRLNDDLLDLVQVSKLIQYSGGLGHNEVEDNFWYKNRDNFIDIDIDYETDQQYKDVLVKKEE